MEGKLQKPVFVKVSSLENSRDGYNVYVRVVSVEHETSANQNFDMVRVVVADETGAANAFFKGDNAKLIKKDSVIAIRNGKVRLVKGHISLEVDIFGRITEEKLDIKANTTVNISEKEITRRPRPQRDNRPREEGERRPRREDDGERRPRREDDGERRPRREDDGERKPRREEGERRPRREDDGERRPRRDDGERKPREPREDGDRRPPRRDFDGERKPRNEDRPRMEWTKIGAIEPGEEGLNIIAKILSVEHVKNKVRVVLGDDTGKVKGFFFDNESIKEGTTVVIFRGEASVVKEHIEIQCPRGGRIEESKNKKIHEVDESVDISAKAWVESA